VQQTVETAESNVKAAAEAASADAPTKRAIAARVKDAETKSSDDDTKVLVFRSADPDYFISHVDVTKVKEYREEAAKLAGEPSIALLFRYLSAKN
jgi:hypothetical protein